MKSRGPIRYAASALLLCGIISYGAQPLHSRSRPPADSRPPAKHFPDVRLPREYRVPAAQCRQLRDGALVVDLYARSFSQGMAVYAEVYLDPAGQGKELILKKMMFEGGSVPLSARGWGYRAIFALNPDTAPGTRQLTVDYVTDGTGRTVTFPVTVAATRFPFNRHALDLGTYSDIDYRPTPEQERFIRECSRKKKKVFGRTSGDELGRSLSHPRDHHFITSQFYAKRMIMRYRKVKNRKVRHKDRLNVHRGLDLRGKTGEPIFAMAGGKVAIAEPMYYEGNFVVIDHGNRIFTCYMHCDRLDVREGDRVEAGHTIARVGSTGISTAAHLHVSLFIRDIPVDPLSLLALPIRD